MSSKLLIESNPHETRVALVEGERLTELWLERHRERGALGNIYRGRVARLVPGIQAAFVDIGLERNAFLYAGDVRDGLAELGDLVEEGEDEEALEDAPPVDQRPIDELLSPGQELLVQVRKEPLPRKGARVTTQITLPGRYLVLLPTAADVGVSRRIEDEAERQRLLGLLEELGPVPGGVIVRTAGRGRGADELARDLDYLAQLWREIAGRAERASAPERVHQELGLARRLVRDRLDGTLEVVWVDGEETHQQIRRQVEQLDPGLAERVRLYPEPERLFAHFGLQRQLEAALKSRIWLKSGGYLIIHETEALVAIDVNTGRYLGRRSLEETVLAANLEAAEEVARQLRLRDLGGIIVVDFIDMVDDANRERVVAALEERLRHDPARTQVSEVSEFGLVQLTRKRSRASLGRLLTRPCPCCAERGRVKSTATVCLELRRHILIGGGGADRAAGELVVRLHPEVAEALAGEWSAVVDELEERLGGTLRVEADPAVGRERFELSVGS